LKEVQSMSREQLAARLALNFSKHCIEKLDYPQDHITIIDAQDHTALDQGMKEQLYNLLNHARYSTMKYGGDFPYLSNHQEYAMLVQVHLRRNHKYRQLPPITTPITKKPNKQNENNAFFQSKPLKNVKKHNLPDLLGVFDHRRLYHDQQKEALFRDQDKDGLVPLHYASDSSQSSDMMDLEHTEDDKRKRMNMMMMNGDHGHSEDDHARKEDDHGQQTPPLIQDSDSHHQHDDLITYYSGEHTKYYSITDDKKRQYAMDKKIKKRRYKEYLARKKKAYKKYLAYKRRENGDDINPENIPKKASSKKKQKKKTS